MAKKPPLTLVRSTPKGPAPPRSLDKPGLSLWNSIQTEYDISDSGGAEMLLQACGALDRAEALRAEIDKDGEIIRTRSGIKVHPGVKDELACRAFVVRTLQRLGLNFEAIKPAVGRPPGPILPGGG
jgi:hypothetical protein